MRIVFPSPAGLPRSKIAKEGIRDFNPKGKMDPGWRRGWAVLTPEVLIPRSESAPMRAVLLKRTRSTSKSNP